MEPDLNELLLRHGAPLQEVAAVARVTTECLRKLRAGQVKRPHIRTLARIADALGLDVREVRDACLASRAAGTAKPDGDLDDFDDLDVRRRETARDDE